MSSPSELDPSISLTTDVELLKKAWRSEKAAPEILQFEAALVQRSREQIQLLEDTMEDYEENGIDPLTVSLYQMDLDRTQFLLRSYLRTRLQKVEKYMIHIKKTDAWNRLSEQEQNFANRCENYMEKHLKQTVLSRLPHGYQSMLQQSISNEEDDMVPEPQVDTFVLCKSKRYLGSYQLDESGEESLDMEAGDLYCIRYNSVKALIETGQIEIL